MSLTKNTQELHAKINKRNVAILIANALREIHPNENAAVKRISRKTGIEIRTIEGWFQSRNMPNTKHLLLLMQHYSEVREAVSRFVYPESETPQNISTQNDSRSDGFSAQNFDPFHIYRVIFDPINSIADSRKISDLNLRQLWFVSELHNSLNPNPESIRARWSVSKETAKRDIAKLRQLKLIRFVGAKRNGRYELV